MRLDFNPSLYFVADPSLCGGWDIAHVVEQALHGGVTLLQLRDKDTNKDKILHNAKLLKDVVGRFNAGRGDDCVPVHFLINDHVDIAMEAGADGMHLGQGDMDVAQARKLLGPDKIIGLTAFTAAQIDAVDPDIIDYIGTGPVYETKTDKGKPVLGLARFAQLVKLSPVPVVGIGGITPGNAAPVLDAGAAGIAMMRAISESPDPESAAHKFKALKKSY